MTAPMSDAEAALWREELAAEHAPARRSAMPRAKRTPGTSNAPGGRWYSTPDAARVNKPRRFTLTPRAAAALAFLAPDEGQRSSAVCDALIAHAEARGWKEQT